jgi:DNA polymerase III alpha subunit (gram-positive type)
VKPTDYQISISSTKIHGITQERAFEEGLERGSILQELKKALIKSDTIIAHNMQFDNRMIVSELNRLDNNDIFHLWENKTKICTMKEARRVYGKNLKLSDLYVKLTGEPVPQNIHQADTDTNMCAQVYFNLKKEKETLGISHALSGI